MPIREENKHRYPKDWPQISQRIRERAGNKCERCNAQNGHYIIRMRSEDWGFEPAYITTDNMVFSAEDGRVIGSDYYAAFDMMKAVRVVLTVAHLDHQPENSADDNLRAWCQRCHNIYDAPMRAKGIAERRKAGMATGDLFGGVTR
jgi:5-methylcytosine-specific restriction endonuclease McrA